MALTWKSVPDDDDNDRYEAESGLFDDPAIYPDADPEPLHWVISQSLKGNHVVWDLKASDPDLLNCADVSTTFLSFLAAQRHCERREAALMAKAGKEVG